MQHQGGGHHSGRGGRGGRGGGHYQGGGGGRGGRGGQNNYYNNNNHNNHNNYHGGGGHHQQQQQYHAPPQYAAQNMYYGAPAHYYGYEQQPEEAYYYDPAAFGGPQMGQMPYDAPQQNSGQNSGFVVSTMSREEFNSQNEYEYDDDDDDEEANSIAPNLMDNPAHLPYTSPLPEVLRKDLMMHVGSKLSDYTAVVERAFTFSYPSEWSEGVPIADVLRHHPVFDRFLPASPLLLDPEHQARASAAGEEINELTPQPNAAGETPAFDAETQNLASALEALTYKGGKGETKKGDVEWWGYCCAGNDVLLLNNKTRTGLWATWCYEWLCTACGMG